MTSSFARLVSVLKRSGKTCTVVEQSCGGLVNAGIMARPGASAVYRGGTVAYDTRRARPLLLNDARLHDALLRTTSSHDDGRDAYVASKREWTSLTSVAYCERLGVDYCVAEGGATGPTYRPRGMDRGFSVVSVAGRSVETGRVEVLAQRVLESTGPDADRSDNMAAFADGAAETAADAVEEHLRRLHDKTTTTTTMTTTEAPPTTPIADQLPFLDRATKLRSDPEAVREMESRGVYVAIRKNEILFDMMEPLAPELALLSQKDVRAAFRGNTAQTTFLGLQNNEERTPFFGIDIFMDDYTDAAGPLRRPFYEWADTRTTAPLLSPRHNEVALHAVAYAQWQRRSAFCPHCGGPTVLVDGGAARRCANQNCAPGQAMMWPRQDPSIIVSVASADGSRLLLARSPRHPPRVHTVLAGFVEAGETLERAVARETLEETGVVVDPSTIRYVASQPWPFPQSTMLAFSARASPDSETITIDEDEILSASWFDRADVEAASAVQGSTMQKAVAEKAIRDNPDLKVLVPPRGVVARTLIDQWLYDADVGVAR